MIIQLPTGKTANVDTSWWLGLSDDEIKRFYESNVGSDIDPASVPIPVVEEDVPDPE